MDNSNTSQQKSAPAAQQPSKQLGHYELRGLLATGGMAEIYAAVPSSGSKLPERVVIKRLRPHLLEHQSSVRMLYEEGWLGTNLSHPKICQVYELGCAQGEPFIAMEYLHGESLSHLIRANQGLPIAFVANIVAQVCEGLHYAHERAGPGGKSLRIIHRDISPENILVGSDGCVHLLDFGIAKSTDSSKSTKQGALKGKSAYMSPEQLRVWELDGRTDVWSLGVVLWEALTDSKLFRRASFMEAAWAIDNEEIPDVRSLRPDAPDALSAVVAKALARDRECRFRSAEMFRCALLESIPGAGDPVIATRLAEFVTRTCAPSLRAKESLFDQVAPPPSSRGRAQSGTRMRSRLEAASPLETGVRRLDMDVASEDSPEPPRAPEAPAATLASLSVLLTKKKGLTTPANPAHGGAQLRPSAAMPSKVLQASEPGASSHPSIAHVEPAGTAPLARPPVRNALRWVPGPRKLLVIMGFWALGRLLYLQQPELTEAPRPAPVVAEQPEALLPGPGEAELAKAFPPGPGVVDPPLPAGPIMTALPQADLSPQDSQPREAALVDTPAAESADRAAKPVQAPWSPAAGSARAQTARRKVPRKSWRRPVGRPGSLYVDAHPYATLYLDHRKIGVTPLLGKTLPPGRHLLVAVAATGATQKFSILVPAGGTIRKRIQW